MEKLGCETKTKKQDNLCIQLSLKINSSTGTTLIKLNSFKKNTIENLQLIDKKTDRI